MIKKRIAIIGSHGLYANYGGWDQLVQNLAEKKSDEMNYLIFNSSDTPKNITIPENVEVKWSVFKASGFQGMFFDFWSILVSYFKVDVILFLGVQGIPLIPVLSLFKKLQIVSNVGGIEWERPKFSFFAKLYLKWCFRLSFKYSAYVILDNKFYEKFIPKDKLNAKPVVLPYGGEIDNNLTVNDEIVEKYPFINEKYFLSISRSLADNKLDELCWSFTDSKQKLVLISNFSKSEYGQDVYEKYKNIDNIVLIKALYFKPELDLIRRKCAAYIHTHTLCGTAPSLVEMIMARVPIISADVPQNRFTLDNQGYFYKSFEQIHEFIDQQIDLSNYIPEDYLCERYQWEKIVEEYESLF